jgi:long-chain acyl-CoA synthetase
MQNFFTLVELIEFISKRYQNPKAFNFQDNIDQEWQHISTEEFADNIRVIALALEKIGVKKNDGFGIASYQNPIWLMMDFASIACGAISVPIFPNIAPQNLLFQAKDSDIKFIFCDNLENLQTILNSGIKFKKIIIRGFEFVADNIISFEELLAIGKEIYQEAPEKYKALSKKIKPDDLATIIYTSGSTGVPKGVEITHSNLVSQIRGAKKFFHLNYKEDIALSFLPLAHIFERMVVCFYISEGVSIYFSDDVRNVGTLMTKVQPTIMTVVPRVLEKVFIKMKNGVDEAPFLKRIIGRLAFSYAKKQNPDIYKHKFYKYGKKRPLTYKILDHLVYKKLRSAMGGKLKMIICGGAALNIDLEKFYQNIGINLYVGYGATESSPVISANCRRHHKTGSVGKPFPGVKVKISQDKELLAKGENIMRGYHNSPEKTAQAIKDGWLLTGDLAQIDQDGFIKIIGRKKEMFKTTNGKYVSPVPIEQKLNSSWQLICESLIIAEGRKFVSCLLFVDFDNIERYKKKIGLQKLKNEDFLNSDFVKQRTEKLIHKVNQDLNHWEKIQKFHLVKKPISIKTGELTPSMKLRRNFVEEKFKDIIEGFYEE